MTSISGIGSIPESWDVQRAKWLMNRERRPINSSDQVVTAFRDGTVTLRANRRLDGFTEALQEIGYQGIRKGDLVVHSMDGFAGAIGISDSNGKASPVVHAYTPTPRVDLRYYAYILRQIALNGRITSFAKGIRERSTAFDAPMLANLALPVPPLEEQRHIADFLDAETARIDKLIAAQVRLTSLLKEREVADIEYTLISQSTTSVRLKNLMHAPLSYGANESADHDNRNWPRYIRTTDITEDGTLRDETFASLPPLVAQKYMLDDGDILLVRSGATVGKTLLYESRFGPAAHAGYLIRGRVDRNKIIPRLLWHYCQTSLYWQQIEEGAVKATIQNVNAEKYGNISVPIFNMDTQAQIVNYIDNQVSRSRYLQNRILRQRGLLAERRQALITAAVTGQFDVSTASGRGVTE